MPRVRKVSFNIKPVFADPGEAVKALTDTIEYLYDRGWKGSYSLTSPSGNTIHYTTRIQIKQQRNLHLLPKSKSKRKSASTKRAKKATS